MSILKEVTLYQMKIPFKFSFGHGSAKRVTSDSFVLVLKTNDGKIGFGEGLPREYVTGETLETSTEFFSKKIFPNLLKKKELLNPMELKANENLIEIVNPFFSGFEFSTNVKDIQ